MKDERVWDFSQCQIGHPCSVCIDTCSFKIIHSLDKGQEKKKKKNERITQEHEERV